MTQIFVNLPTTDLERAKTFYQAIGAEVVPEFTDDNASCIKWTDDIFFMILTRDFSPPSRTNPSSTRTRRPRR